MEIISASGRFNLPIGFQMEVSIYNPFIKDQGEQSIPVTLPPTPNNMRMIGWSWRLDHTAKPMKDMDVLVRDGIFSQKAILSINSADQVNGINCTVYFNRSAFYSKLEDKEMCDLQFDDIKSPDYDILTNPQRVDYLINLIEREDLAPSD